MLFINGEWKSSLGGTFESVNPATGEVLNEVANGTAQDTEEAISAAQEAFESWSALTPFQRSKYLYDAYALMVEKK